MCAAKSYFEDPELKNAQPARTADGALCYVEGPDSIVFRMIGLSREIALKLYTRDDPDRAMHYTESAAYLQQAMTQSVQVGQYFVEFTYVSRGLKFFGKRFPVLKMDWVEGQRLDSIIGWQGRNSVCAAVMYEFRRMVTVLGNAYVTHGDLTPTNIIWTGDGLKLVDYDNLQTPGMNQNYTRSKSAELKHPRSNGPVCPYDDYYASWVIDTALYIGTAESPSTMVEPSAIISSAEDLCNPDKLMNLIGGDTIGAVRRRVQLLDTLRVIDLTEIPRLNLNASLKNKFADKYGLTLNAVTPSHVSPDADASLIAPPRRSMLSVVSTKNFAAALTQRPAHTAEYVMMTTVLLGALVFTVQYHFWDLTVALVMGLLYHELWTPRKGP